MTIDDIEDKESILIVKISGSKARRSRIFVISNSDSIDYLSFYRRYIALRPKDEATTRRLFLKYNEGTCSNQVVGMHSIAKMPSEIANYLKLPDCHLYTIHCFRRTAATLLVYGGGNITQLKRHAAWKNSKATEGYIEDNINNENKECSNENRTSKNIFSGPITVQHIEYKTDQEYNKSSSDIPSGSGIIVENCKNCTFNFKISNKK